MSIRTPIYLSLTFLIIEALCRVLLWFLFGSSLLHPSDIIYKYYPMVREIREKYYQTDKAAHKILVLSCSTLHREWGGFGSILEQDLRHPASRSGIQDTSYSVFNAAGVGFTSRDNLNCYRLLSSLHFDLVIDYSGINDARMNNCPASVYKADYGHTSWSNEVDCILRHAEMNFSVIPFFFDYLYQLIYQSVCPDRFIPIHYTQRPEWWQYGRSLNSVKAFDNNVTAIATIGKNRGETILIIPYCYYIPEDYSLDRFMKKQLNYQFQLNSREIEIWGRPADVGLYLDSTNNTLSRIALESGAIYFDPRSEILPHKEFFADVCHFSPAGLSFFASSVSNETFRIFSPQAPILK